MHSIFHNMLRNVGWHWSIFYHLYLTTFTALFTSPPNQRKRKRVVLLEFKPVHKFCFAAVHAGTTENIVFIYTFYQSYSNGHFLFWEPHAFWEQLFFNNTSPTLTLFVLYIESHDSSFNTAWKLFIVCLLNNLILPLGSLFCSAIKSTSVTVDSSYNGSLFQSPSVSSCFTTVITRLYRSLIYRIFGYIGLLRLSLTVEFPRLYCFWQSNGQFTAVTVCSGTKCSLARVTRRLRMLFDRILYTETPSRLLIFHFVWLS